MYTYQCLCISIKCISQFIVNPFHLYFFRFQCPVGLLKVKNQNTINHKSCFRILISYAHSLCLSLFRFAFRQARPSGARCGPERPRASGYLLSPCLIVGPISLKSSQIFDCMIYVVRQDPKLLFKAQNGLWVYLGFGVVVFLKNILIDL